jgi:hypothetical protein
MRVAAIASLLCAAGCRQLLGLDSPDLGSGSNQPDARATDASGDGAPLRDATPSAATFVGGATANGNAMVTAMLPGEGAGDVLVIGVAWAGTATVTLSDTDGNTYVAIDQVGTSDPFTLRVFSANISSVTSTNTITAQLSGNDALAIVIADYRGLAGAVPLDGFIGTTGAGTPVTSSSLTTTNANDILTAIGVSASPMAAAAPFTSRERSPLGEVLLEDLAVTTAGSYQASETQSGSGNWMMELVALRVAP